MVKRMFLNKVTTSMAMVLLAVLGTVAVTYVLATGGRAAADEKPKKDVNGLSAKIVVTSKQPVQIEEIKAELVLTNEGEKPLRLCTLCGEWRSVGAGDYKETFKPDFFKSCPPRADESASHVVTLQPGKSVSLSISPINTYGGNPHEVDGKLKIAAGYEVGEEFAKKFDTWVGRVEAEPVVISVKEADPEGPRSWSTPVNGLQAHLSFVRKEAVNGTPIIATYLELKNVSEQGNVMEVALDPGKIRFTVTDAAGKEVKPDNGPFDGGSVDDLGALRLPYDSSLRFNISSNGAGIPNGQAGLLDLGVSRDWVFKSGDKGKYYLQGRFTVEKRKYGSWSGTVVLPKVKIPTAGQ
jgi:hypothetical protein